MSKLHVCFKLFYVASLIDSVEHKKRNGNNPLLYSSSYPITSVATLLVDAYAGHSFPPPQEHINAVTANETKSANANFFISRVFYFVALNYNL